MLTGKRAFEGDDVSDTLASVLRQEVTLDRLPADTPRSIRRLIARCLERDVKRRLRDIGEARIVLENPEDVDSSERAPMARFVVPLPEGQAFSGSSRRFLAVSPDGSRIAYFAGNRIHFRSLSATNPQAVPGTDAYGAVLDIAFSPDGQSLVFWASMDRTLKKVGINGGAAVTICSLTVPTSGISWDAAGLLFAFEQGGIMRLSPNGGTPETVVTSGTDETVYGPQLLPDGTHILFTVAHGNAADRWDKADIVVQRIGSSDRKVLVQGGSDARYLPTGHLIYALGGILFAAAFDADRLELKSGPVPHR
jgi:hypothetical protein